MKGRSRDMLKRLMNMRRNFWIRQRNLLNKRKISKRNGMLMKHFDRHANLKYKYGNRNFWCRGYYVDTVGKNAKKIEAYIRNQLVEDKMQDQLTLREYTDPFTGEPESRNRR